MSIIRFENKVLYNQIGVGVGMGKLTSEDVRG